MIQSAASTIQQNSLVNQVNTSGLPSQIVAAIKHAANATGVDFSYLLNKASQESSFDPTAKASTSSATGLYQFTQQTWLQMVKNNGSQYGLGDYASHITTDSSGALHVKDATWRTAILNLRNDPMVSAEMAGELDKQNQTTLQDNVGGKIGGTELYLAHFLGAGGASEFLNEMRSNPSQQAASVLPEAADANPNVFYAKDGTPKTLSQIYQHFAQKFDGSAPQTYSVASSASSSTATTKAANMTIASSTSANVTSPFSGMPTAMMSSASGLQSNSSQSLFATMVLAQMNDESSALSKLTGTYSDDKNRSDKKLASDILSAAA